MGAGDLFGALQQGRAQADVLGGACLLAAHRQGLAVDVDFADEGRALQVGQVEWFGRGPKGRFANL